MPFDPDFTANLLRRLAREKVGCTIAFGAGRRTAEALAADREAARLALDAVVDDDPTRQGQHVCGFVVQAPSEMVSRAVCRVLICSEMFLEQLTLRAQELYGSEIEILTSFDQSASLVSQLTETRRIIEDAWSGDHDRESLWLASDRLMSTLRDKLECTAEWRYGPQRQVHEFLQMRKAIDPFMHLAGRTVLNAGCGRYHPIGQSLLATIAGAECAVAIDIEPPLDLARSARAAADLIAHVLINPQPLGVTRAAALNAIDQHIDPAALERGELRAALRTASSSRLDLRIGSITDSDFLASLRRGRSSAGFDLIVSRDVFEHILDVPAALASLGSALKPDGLLVLWIDFSDHRRYTNPGRFEHWAHMAESAPGELKQRSDTNGLRFPHYRALFTEAGLHTLRYEPIETRPIPAHVRADLAPMYRELADADLAVCRAIAVLQKASAVQPSSKRQAQAAL